MSIPSTVLNLRITALASNLVDQAITFDPNMSVPWDLVVDADLIWVANSGSGLVTVYNRLGEIMLPFVKVTGNLCEQLQPTGIAINRTNGYVMRIGPVKYPSQLIIATREGYINGYHELVDPENSRPLVKTNAVYTGVTVASLLYACDFYHGKIDTFDGLMRPINLPFVDEDSTDPIPLNYAPYNICLVNNELFVTYAERDCTDSSYAQPGRSKGYVSVFDLQGRFLRRFYSKGVLNCPYSVMMAPSSYGYPIGSVLISNFGSGQITVHGQDGTYLDNLRVDQQPIMLGGLHGLSTGGTFDRALYWASTQAGISEAFVGNIVVRSDFFIG